MSADARARIIAETLDALPEINVDADGVTHTYTGDDRLPIVEAMADAQLAHAAEELRMKRNALLAASDWTQVPDAPVNVAAWAEYRQALRDLPETTDDPTAPDWPKAP